MIQAEAGSRDKMRFDEKTLEPIGGGRVSRPYPYPYGFVLETTAADGGNVDCYVAGDDTLKSGSIVDCEVVGLLDQFESGEPDHKVLAVVAGAEKVLPDRVFETLRDFIYEIFSEYPNTSVSVGPIHPRDAAMRYILECQACFEKPPEGRRIR